MRPLIRRIDEVLARVPSDSIHARATREELLGHFESSVDDRLTGGDSLEKALEHTLESFGDAEPLERDYYDDYLRSRFRLFGLIDMEEWTAPRATARLGLFFAAFGLLFGWLIPTIGAFSSAFGTARVSINQSGVVDLEAVRDASDLATHSPFPETMTLLTGYGEPSPPPTGTALGILGFVLLIAATILTLRRVHPRLTAQAVPLGILIAGLGAFFVWASTAVVTYADAIFDLVYTSETARLGESARTLSQVGSASLGLLLLTAVSLAILLVRARREQLARTILLRQLASAAALSTVGLVLASHRHLASTILDLSEDIDSVSPAQLVGAIDFDLAQFVVGGLLLLFGVLRFERCLERALRIHAARSPLAE
ncbi:MAG: hypothetical protein AAF196_06755 [Planctomycetota bacterium]